MLTINSLDEYRAHVAHKEEIREMDLGHGVVSFCYMIAAENTFDDEWSREARGIVFEKSYSNVVGRPLHKFFNVNERESTRAENLDWTKVVRVMDKRDGSMIHSVWTRDGMRLKSKKSFESDVAKAAEDWMHSQPGLNVFKFIGRMAALEKTAIFEWTAPDARIVLLYPEAELRLLHVRDNKTGQYMELEELRNWAAEYGVNVVDHVNLQGRFEEFAGNTCGFLFQQRNAVIVDFLRHLVQTTEGVEGWVFQFDDGEMVKLKTEWYLKRHRAMTFLRERDVAQLVLDEGLDDLKSLLVGDGVDIKPILEIEDRVLHDLRELALAVDLAVSEDQHLDRKSFAIKHNGSDFFGLKMSKYLGKEPNFKEFFERNILKEKYSLKQIALLDTVAEAE